MASGGRDNEVRIVTDAKGKKRFMRKSSPFEGKSMPAPRPGDAPHRSCNHCWQGQICEVEEEFRCPEHEGQDLPGSMERQRRDEFRQLAESGQLGENPCLPCWNGSRHIERYLCSIHRRDTPVQRVEPSQATPA